MFCDINGKNVVVTGGCKGIGKAITQKFLENGSNVAATYYTSEGAANSLKDELKQYSNNLKLYKMDVSDAENVNSVMTKIQDDMNGVDVLINNAGIISDSLLYSMKISEWDKVIKTNLYGAFYTSKSVLLNMIMRKSGSIINIASVSGLNGIAGQSNYCASKFGLIGLTKSLAKEVASKNIRVNAIAPGFIDTEMISDVKSTLDISKNKHSMRRLGKPEEIANIALFLASDLASYMTGQVLTADGGTL